METGNTGSHLFALKNREMYGTLESALRKWREEGLSYRKIATILSYDGTPVKRATVPLWCKKLGIE
jgi:hypothetical protein